MKLYICSTNSSDKITPSFLSVFADQNRLLGNQAHNIPSELKPQADEAMSIMMRLLCVRYVLAISICVKSKSRSII